MSHVTTSELSLVSEQVVMRALPGESRATCVKIETRRADECGEMRVPCPSSAARRHTSQRPRCRVCRSGAFAVRRLGAARIRRSALAASEMRDLSIRYKVCFYLPRLCCSTVLKRPSLSIALTSFDSVALRLRLSLLSLRSQS